MASISKKTLEYLAELGRIRIDKKEEGKLLHDLEKIIAYFDELKEVDTEGVLPLAGGTIMTNIFRDDDPTQTNADQTQTNADLTQNDADDFQRKSAFGQRESTLGSQREPALSQRKSALVEQFPEEEGGFLKVPAVFEQ